MIIFGTLAVLAGILVSLSRQINGRLALSTTAMESSFWNHIVGLGFITIAALIFGGLFAGTPQASPWWAYLGGPIGVIFIAAGSWLIAKIGAAQTAMLIIAGQMISGVVLDIAMGTAGNTWARVIGVGLILAGMWVGQRQAANRRTSEGYRPEKRCNETPLAILGNGILRRPMSKRRLSQFVRTAALRTKRSLSYDTGIAAMSYSFCRSFNKDHKSPTSMNAFPLVALAQWLCRRPLSPT